MDQPLSIHASGRWFAFIIPVAAAQSERPVLFLDAPALTGLQEGSAIEGGNGAIRGRPHRERIARTRTQWSSRSAEILGRLLEGGECPYERSSVLHRQPAGAARHGVGALGADLRADAVRRVGRRDET